MRILIVNDDGIHAKGLHVLAEAASSFGETLVVAPHVECSACSHAITLHSPLRVLPRGPHSYAVTGTPTDCVYLGIHQISDLRPAIVLSGINHGPNLGLDVLYSGTVAAAMEGWRAGIPSIAFSLVGRNASEALWEQTGRVVGEVLSWFLSLPSQDRHPLLNVNIPALPLETPAPLEAVSLGDIEYPPHVDVRDDPKGGAYYWIGGKGPILGQGPGTDCAVVQEQRVSITPLQLDLTDHKKVETLRSLLSDGRKPSSLT